MRYIDCIRIAASITASDDVINLVTRRIFISFNSRNWWKI